MDGIEFQMPNTVSLRYIMYMYWEPLLGTWRTKRHTDVIVLKNDCTPWGLWGNHIRIVIVRFVMGRRWLPMHVDSNDLLRMLERIAEALESLDVELENSNDHLKSILDETKWYRR